MSKQINPNELAEIVTRLLTEPERADELDSTDAFQSFMTGIAQVVCDHCGGEIHYPAEQFEDTWYIGIHGNDSLPDESGGIWQKYDPDGELFSESGSSQASQSES